MKVAFGVEYDGSKFFGWQRQTSVRTVQQCVEEALSRVADSQLKVYCAGRTDTGVHATGQVIHVETGAQRTTRSWVLGANSNLPHDVSILWAQPVEESFHARFSAIDRAYRYVICNRVARPGLWSAKVSFVFQPLNADRMREAAQHLLGRHDFSSFRAAGCQAAHPIREVRRIDVRRQGHFVTVDVEANAFLQHMVRNIVGTLIAVGDGRETPNHMATVLNARSRVAAGQTAAPDGLYLTEVSYPSRFDLPQAPTNHVISLI
jgi:tRNA pseudouridine38-40 synthase